MEPESRIVQLDALYILNAALLYLDQPEGSEPGLVDSNVSASLYCENETDVNKKRNNAVSKFFILEKVNLKLGINLLNFKES